MLHSLGVVVLLAVRVLGDVVASDIDSEGLQVFNVDLAGLSSTAEDNNFGHIFLK